MNCALAELRPRVKRVERGGEVYVHTLGQTAHYGVHEQWIEYVPAPRTVERHCDGYYDDGWCVSSCTNVAGCGWTGCPSDGDRAKRASLALRSSSPIYCEHANESPSCPCGCGPFCYCRVHGGCR